MKRLIFSLFAGLVFILISCSENQLRPVDYVNPFLGTGGHGHTYPGTSMPFGMIQVSPDTRLEGWDGCSAYHFSDSVMYGISHTHLSGTGCSDYGDILLMPVSGDPGLDNYAYRSGFDKKTEKAKPGYYEVYLKKPGVRVSLTSSYRSGMHRYEFEDPGKAGVVLDLVHRDLVLESSLKINSPQEVEGVRISKAWADKQVLYFVLRFSSPIYSRLIKSGDEVVQAGSAEGKEIRARFGFKLAKGEPLMIKIGISAVSAEGARKNLEKEIPGWDFDRLAFQADSIWSGELGKIKAEGGTKEQMQVFYTSMYHSMLSPNLYTDVDGQYLGRDFKAHRAEGFDYYTVFSLWDTYRAEHPLLSIIDRRRTSDFINTFITQYEQGGALPVWELSGNETGCMIGYHAVPVIADAYLKGIKGYDEELALKAMLNSAESDRLGLKFYKTMGYIPSDLEGESVSRTLEYAYDDWCISVMARSMGKTEEFREYNKRSQYYKNVFDPTTKFMRAKANSTWFTPFDPSEVNFNYTEANAWQYSFYVPQDISGLMSLHGGADQFAASLDKLFSASSRTTGRDQADITGLIGQYAHGNEPSHHMAYLYDYAGKPWKTQEMVNRICRDFYRNQPEGLCGNEDCGQMSSWFVFSAMGFYPVTPASGIYAIGSPLFRKLTISLENGKKFIIEAENAGEGKPYISSATLNGKPYSRCFIRHEDIMSGGILKLQMSARPDTIWGTGSDNIPVSSLNDGLITPVPSVDASGKTFLDTMRIRLVCPLADAKIFYTLNGSEPDEHSTLYQNHFTISATTRLKAVAISPNSGKSMTAEAIFLKIPKDRRISLMTQYSGQYSAGGSVAMIDFIRGGDNFKTGAWQGYEGCDIDATVDLGKIETVRKISIGCLQDQGSWIFMPREVRFSISTDGKKFDLLPVQRNTIDERSNGPIRFDFTVSTGGKKARFIRVYAVNRGVCPDWHPGAGKKAWLFTDEIEIE
jgi:predicted alpha-1,2-mannosidase